MAEENDPIPGTDPAGADPGAAGSGEPGQGEGGGAVDWKAQARKWERLAKQNLEKAEKLDEIEEQSKSETQKAIERAEKAERELNDLKQDAERQGLINKVAAETGIPASLLSGETEEELTASAKAISEFVESKKPGFPVDKGGSNPKSTKVTIDSIEKIKNPLERVRARAEHSELYQ